jgi:hypothetical protein
VGMNLIESQCLYLKLFIGPSILKISAILTPDQPLFLSEITKNKTENEISHEPTFFF